MTLRIQTLEERILYDAAPVDPEAPESDEGGAPHELVVIDGRLADAADLAAAAPEGAEVHVLDPGEDGLGQILAILSGREGVDAVHVISHGDVGRFEIGSTVLDASSLADRAGDLVAWGRTLSPDGDILLYGCRVGEGGEGAAFASALAALTGADVAVSTDNTGGKAAGGDWDLEYTSGPIEAGLPASLAALEAHDGLLLLAPQGGEFLVNSTTALSQFDPSVGVDGAGNFAVAWRSNEGAGNYDIRARRFDSAGNPLGADFVANSTTANTQFGPSVARDGAGNFVIAWVSDEGAGDFDIRARRFDGAGNPLGADFVVNSTTANDQRDVSASVDGAGNLVIVWRSDEGGVTGYDIRARRFDSAGNPLGADFVVNSTTADAQFEPSVARDGAGNFVVAWTSIEGGGDYDIRARRFDGAGNPLGLDFVVSNTTANAQFQASVAHDGAGNLLIAWASFEGADYDIRARRFDSAGNPLGVDFVVNSTTASEQLFPSLARDGAGDSVIAWSSREGGSYDIRAREFDPAGTPVGLDFVVNTTTASTQTRSSTASSNQGNVVVTWASLHPGNYDIFAQRFSLPQPAAPPEAPPAPAPEETPATPIDPVTLLDILGPPPPSGTLESFEAGAGFPSWDLALGLPDDSLGIDLSDDTGDGAAFLADSFGLYRLRRGGLLFPGLWGG